MLHAIIIGINRYKDKDISDLNYAVDDARSFAERIKKATHAADRNVMLLLDEEATKEKLQIAIGEILPRFAQSNDDIVILYFAGHGSPELSGSPDDASRYLVAYDTQYDHIYATAIDLERDVTRWFKRITSPRLILFFIDACFFSGRAGGRTFEGPHLNRRRSNGERFAWPIELKRLEFGDGRAMLTACDDDQVARENSVIKHGVFTHWLLKILSQKSEDATISVAELYETVRQEVLADTEGRQGPILNGRIAGARMLRLPA